MVFTDTRDVLVGEFNFGKGKPFPDDDHSIIDGFVDYDGITDLSVNYGQKKLALVRRTQGEEPAGGCSAELKDHAIGAFIIRGERAEGGYVPCADCGALLEEDFLSCRQLLEDLPVAGFSLQVETDRKIRCFFASCSKSPRQDYSRNEDGKG